MPKRVIVAIMLFLMCLINYMMRVNLSLNIIAMVEQRDENNTIIQSPDVRISRKKSEPSYMKTYFIFYLNSSMDHVMIGRRRIRHCC